jgi:hypothetical protein
MADIMPVTPENGKKFEKTSGNESFRAARAAAEDAKFCAVRMIEFYGIS